MKLEPSGTPFEPVDDRRPRIEAPLPVALVAVGDCELEAPAGAERELDAFYVGVLGFERRAGESVFYQAENFGIRFAIVERPGAREDYLPLGITVRSIDGIMKALREREIEFSRQQKLVTGLESIMVYDPAGNLLEIGQTRTIL